MTDTTGKFTIDEVGFIQIASSKVLAAVARGQDENGQWVGSERAAQIHQV